MKSGFVIGALNKSEKYSNVTRLRAYLDRGPNSIFFRLPSTLNIAYLTT